MESSGAVFGSVDVVVVVAALPCGIDRGVPLISTGTAVVVGLVATVAS